MQIPVNESNETTALIHELMEAVSKEAKQLFVSSAEDLAQQYYGSREGKVLQIAVDDTADTDLEWLQQRLAEAATTTIGQLETLVENLVEERDEARAEVERLRGWQESIADGTGYILRAEGQGGYEAADPETIIAAWRRLEREADAAANAYQRGAEAMREAAATQLACYFPKHNPTGRCGMCVLCSQDVTTEIREIPIPEDK